MSNSDADVGSRKNEALAELREIGMPSFGELTDEQLDTVAKRHVLGEISEEALRNILRFCGSTSGQLTDALKRVIDACKSNNEAAMENIRLAIEKFGYNLESAETAEERQQIREAIAGMIDKSQEEARDQRNLLLKFGGGALALIALIMGAVLGKPWRGDSGKNA